MHSTSKSSKLIVSSVVVVATTLVLLTLRAQETAKPETHGMAVANMDPAIKPGDDFYLYANGNWIKRTEIPPTVPRSAGSRSSTKLAISAPRR